MPSLGVKVRPSVVTIAPERRTGCGHWSCRLKAGFFYVAETTPTPASACIIWFSLKSSSTLRILLAGQPLGSTLFLVYCCLLAWLNNLRQNLGHWLAFQQISWRVWRAWFFEDNTNQEVCILPVHFSAGQNYFSFQWILQIALGPGARYIGMFYLGTSQ